MDYDENGGEEQEMPSREKMEQMKEFLMRQLLEKMNAQADAVRLLSENPEDPRAPKVLLEYLAINFGMTSAHVLLNSRGQVIGIKATNSHEMELAENPITMAFGMHGKVFPQPKEEWEDKIG